MKHENSGLQGSSNSIFKENPYAPGGAPPGIMIAKRCELRAASYAAECGDFAARRFCF